MLLLLATHQAPLTTLRLVESPRFARRLAVWMFAALIGSLGAMLYVPWQQTSRGAGRVIAYFPRERPQTVESPIYGRVVSFGEGIVEGAHVKKGQTILEIRDNDEGRAARLVAQVQATKDKLRFAGIKVETYARQEIDLVEARKMVIEAGEALIAEAEQKVDAEKQGVAAAAAALAQTKSNLERQKRLYDAGLKSGTEFERDQRVYDEAVAKKRSAEHYVSAAEKYLASKQAELGQKSREAQTKVDYARAAQQEAEGEGALVRKELSEIEGKQAQFESRVVTAPKDGVILRLFANDNAEMLKEGDPLFTIVPETADRAVELWVNGNDVPLITEGREVRLQFEGWPAVQFAAGWPHVAMGTFSGTVVAVDATDNGKGKYRLLVRPDAGQDWPEDRFLRQGVRANGWVLLNQVSLGYEIWRQLNGFPPVYGEGNASAKPDDKGVKAAEMAEDKEEKPVKKPKLPK